MEEYVQNYSSTVMFRGTPCSKKVFKFQFTGPNNFMQIRIHHDHERLAFLLFLLHSNMIIKLYHKSESILIWSKVYLCLFIFVTLANTITTVLCITFVYS